ncbi:MAG: DUF881 domain-containing protein [Firmicutes bacterium]|nr:DUF881 domain-containing protein [Bacillota bacterium]
MTDRRLLIGVGGVCVVLGLMLSVQYQTSTAAPSAGRAALSNHVQQLQSLEDEQRALLDQLSTLRQRLSSYTQSGDPAAAMESELRMAQQQAGMTSVQGAGVRITLSPAEEGATVPYTDLLNIVNYLLAGGASAVDVNGQRIVATTAIRSAGNGIVVNNTPLTPPYRIQAIGDAEKLRAAVSWSYAPSGPQTYFQKQGEHFQWEEVSDLTVPPFTQVPAFQQVQVVTSADTG